MTQRKISLSLALIGLLLIGAALSSCRQSPEPTASPPSSPLPAEASPTTETSPEDAQASLENDIASSGQTAEEPDYCLDCHTDQEKLMEVADPVVETESENEGEG